MNDCEEGTLGLLNGLACATYLVQNSRIAAAWSHKSHQGGQRRADRQPCEESRVSVDGAGRS